ncbi:MAG: F0F1 ATP synthase subunit A, partial [Sphingobacterium sp.]
MVSLKRALLFFAVIFFAVAPFTLNAAQSEHGEKPQSQSEEINEYIHHHLQDDHYFSFALDKKAGKHYGFPLPVILIDGGVHVFSSAAFDYGHAVAQSNGKYYALYHGKIYK